MKLKNNKKAVKISRIIFALYTVHGVRHCVCLARLCGR